MLEDFINFIQKENLFQREQKVLVAVSGGIDSVVLSKLCAMAKFNFGIAHCNFSLRGEESLADELFVRKLAKTLKIPYHTTCFDTKAFAEKEKLSTQVAARILRYQWFEEISLREGYDWIATAHHQLDSAETILINLTRGTGIAGFHGIPLKNGKIIRPMTFASQESIYEFVVSQKLAWREDSSNETNKYQRNFIRHEIIPKFLELNTQFEKSLSETSAKIQAIESWIKQEVIKFRNQHETLDTSVNHFIRLSANFDDSKWSVLGQQILLEFNFTYGMIQQILAHPAEKVGKLFESPSHILNIDRNQWVISPKDQADFKPIQIQEEDELVDLGDGRQIQIYREENTADFKISTSAKLACMDADLIQFPLEIRKYQEGDWFCPLGMNQKKLISDFLTDKKVPLNLKKTTQLLLSKGSVVWVMGHRMDNRFKIGDKTAHILILEIT